MDRLNIDPPAEVEAYEWHWFGATSIRVFVASADFGGGHAYL